MFEFQPHLTGTFIDMRPMREGDFEPLFAVACDPLIWEVHPDRDRWQPAAFRKFVDGAFADKGGLVAIERATGEIVGFSRYSQTAVKPEDVEIGWTFLSRRLWGGEHNRDMKRIMLVHALAGFSRVIFRVGAANLRSRRAMEKIGGQLTSWRGEIEINGQPQAYVSYKITRDSFAAGPLA